MRPSASRAPGFRFAASWLRCGSIAPVPEAPGTFSCRRARRRFRLARHGRHLVGKCRSVSIIGDRVGKLRISPSASTRVSVDLPLRTASRPAIRAPCVVRVRILKFYVVGQILQTPATPFPRLPPSFLRFPTSRATASLPMRNELVIEPRVDRDLQFENSPCTSTVIFFDTSPFARRRNGCDITHLRRQIQA